MHGYGGKNLAESFRTVRANTLKIAEEIPEDKYSFKPAPDARSVGQLLTHIALLHRIPKQIHQIEKRKTLEGFNFPGMMQALGAEEQQRARRRKSSTCSGRTATPGPHTSRASPTIF
jgi:hypothetical protein